MGIITVKMYVCQCSHCGKLFSTEDHVAWVDEISAHEVATSSDWVHENGFYFCDVCYSNLGKED